MQGELSRSTVKCFQGFSTPKTYLPMKKLGILELVCNLGLDEFIVGIHPQLLQGHDIVRRVAESLGYRGNPLFPILRYDDQSPLKEIANIFVSVTESLEEWNSHQQLRVQI